MKFEFIKSNKIEWDGLSAHIYSTKEDFPRANGALFILTGSHGRVKSKSSDRIYFVVSGSGEFDVDGDIITVKEKDVVIVPKNTPYDYKAVGGQLELFMVHTPAYDSKTEVKL